MHSPPKFARLAARLIPRRYRDSVVEDLAEVWPSELERRGVRAARRWYVREVLVAAIASWWQVLRFATALAPATESADGRAFTVVSDWRQGLRRLRRSPWLSLTTVATLSVGTGAATAIFSLTSSFLLTPPPFPDVDRLVQIQTARGGEVGKISLREIEDVRERFTGAADVASYLPGAQYSLSEGAAPEKASAVLASHNLLHVLGVPLVYGQPFAANYDRERHDAIILSDGLWRRQFGGDASVVGRRVAVDATPGVKTPLYAVSGIAPRGQTFPPHTDIYRSLYIGPDFPNRERRDVRGSIGVARLKPGISVAQAREELHAVSRQLAREYPQTNDGVTFTLTPLADVYTGPIRPYLLLLLGAAATLLVIASVNTANLFLSRALDRRHELAVRSALGATRARLLRQFVLEGGTLAALSGLAGLALARVFIGVLGWFVRIDLPEWISVELDGRTLLFASAVSLLTGFAAIVLPGMRAAPRAEFETIRTATGRSTSGAQHRRLRRVLLASEVAISTLLLIGAGLMLQTFRALQQADVGFRPDGILTFRVALPVYVGTTQARVFNEEMLDRLQRAPGIGSAALTDYLPLAPSAQGDRQGLVAEGQDAASAGMNPYVDYQRVSSRYFDVMDAPILAGRPFDSRDRAATQTVAIVSSSLANRLWPGQDPIGKRFRRPDAQAPWLQIVGVAGDIRWTSLAGGERFDVYLSAAQSPQTWNYVLVRSTAEDALRLADTARAAVWAINPRQPVTEIRTMRDRVLDAVWQQRTSAFLLSVFAGCALALSTVGVYAVTAHAVGQRVREFGIRRALGASRIHIAFVVLAEVGWTAGIGLAVGLGATIAVSRAIRPLLFGVAPIDAATFGGSAVFLLLVTAAAALVPALRAARANPFRALRTE